MQQYGRPIALGLIDEDMRIGEAITAIMLHRDKCNICGPGHTKPGTRRLCVAADMWLGRLIQAWAAGGHHRSYEWLVSNAV